MTTIDGIELAGEAVVDRAREQFHREIKVALRSLRHRRGRLNKKIRQIEQRIAAKGPEAA